MLRIASITESTEIERHLLFYREDYWRYGVIIIEHNLDIIKNSDWIIDIGPEGGFEGGKIIAEGTPEHIAEMTHSYTGQFLKLEMQQA